MMKTAIVMAQWNRQEFFNEIVKNLNKQTYKNFDLFIWNNNSSRTEEIENEIQRAEGYSIYLHNSSTNVFGFGRFLLCKKLFSGKIPYVSPSDYDKVIFMDDDFSFSDDLIRQLVEKFRKKSYLGHWAFKIFSNYGDRERCHVQFEVADYVGTGISIIDPEVFKSDLFFDTIPDKSCYCIEDICLTLFCKRIGWDTLAIPFSLKILRMNHDLKERPLHKRLGRGYKSKRYPKLVEYYNNLEVGV